MRVHGAVTVVTGGGRGIGAALAGRLASEGAAVVVADIDLDAAEHVCEQLNSGGSRTAAIRCDVGVEDDVHQLVRFAERTFGPVGLFCSNAGVSSGTGLYGADAAWQQAWDVNVMGHVHATRAVLPGFLRRGGGCLLATVSAGGLLTVAGDAPYSTTKHAAMGLLEWLACTYAPRGLEVKALCPMGVATHMLQDGLDRGHPGARFIADLAPVLSAEEVAAAAVRSLTGPGFLVLPHAEVAGMMAAKAADLDGWIAGTAATQRATRGRRPAPARGPR